MKTMYEQSSWGWDPVDKQKELTEPTVWYLIASSNNTFVGFSHFRFDIDDREEVLYWYVNPSMFPRIIENNFTNTYTISFHSAMKYNWSPQYEGKDSGIS